MFQEATITMKGLILDTKIRSGQAVANFTHIKLGNGIYNGTEDISVAESLKALKQSFAISSISISDNKTVRLRIVSNNVGITDGYYISELGVYAEDPDDGEILYSIALGVENKMDYQPSETELPGATSTFDVYASVSNVESATIAIDAGAAASAEDLQELRSELTNPTFDDSGEVEGISSFPDFLTSVVSKMNLFQFFRNLKAGLQFVLHAGQIVNNCMSDATNLPLAAAQGKALMDLYTKLNSDLHKIETFAGTVTFSRENPNALDYIAGNALKDGIYIINSSDGVQQMPGDAQYAYGFIFNRSGYKTIFVVGRSGNIYTNAKQGSNDWVGWKKYIGSDES